MLKKHQTIHNALINTASWMFSIVIGFVFLPYIVNKLGAEAYGVLVLVLAVIGYCAVLDLNLGDAIIKYISEYRVGNNVKSINEVVGSVISIFLLVGILASISIYLASNLLSSRLLKIPLELQPATQSAFMAGAVGVLFTMILSALSAIPNGVNRYDITGKMTMVMGVVINLGTVFLLYFGYGLEEIIILNVSITFLGIIFYYFINKTLIPGLKQKPTYSTMAVKNVLHFGIYSALSRLSGIIQFQGIRLLAGVLLGGSAVTFYVVPFNLISRVMTITSRLGTVIFPLVSELQGKKDFTSVKNLYVKATRILLTISTAICLPLLFYGERFIVLWMGNEFGKRTETIMLVLTISLYLDSFTNVPSIVANGLGIPKINSFFSATNTALNLALAYPLSKAMGINGIALSFLICQLTIMPLFVFYVNNRVLGFSILTLAREAYLRPLLSGVLTALPIIFLRSIRTDSITVLLFIMAFVTSAYLLISYVIGVFSLAEKAHFWEYLCQIRRSPRNDTTGSLDD